MSKKILRLYVAGSTVKTERVIDTLRSICAEELHGEYELEVIDVIQQPQLAEDQRIIAIPTLIRILPEPIRRVIGDLVDKDTVLIGLDLQTTQETPSDNKGGK